MKNQSVAITQPAKETAPMKLLPASNLFDRIQDLSNSIARRAFEIFEGRGRADVSTSHSPRHRRIGRCGHGSC